MSRIVSSTAGRRDGRSRCGRGRATRPARSPRRRRGQSAALVVFDKVDCVNVLPRAGLARSAASSTRSSCSSSRRWRSTDGVNLGTRRREMVMEEYAATFGDDDTGIVGATRRARPFTPSLDGPNPQRSGERNNVGDVWVVADLSPIRPWRHEAAARPRATGCVRPDLHALVDSAETIARGGDAHDRLCRTRVSPFRGRRQAVRLSRAECGRVRARRRRRRDPFRRDRAPRIRATSCRRPSAPTSASIASSERSTRSSASARSARRRSPRRPPESVSR